jgi:hypothetical protein
VRARWIALLVVGAAVAVSFFLFRGGTGSVVPGAIEEHSFEPASDWTARIEREQPEPVARESMGLDGPARSAARESIAGPVLAGRVVDAGRAPVRGAVVSWTPVPDWQPWWTGPEDVAEIVERSSIVAKTGDDGSVAFFDLPESIEGTRSVLWITSEGHEALAVEVPVERERWPGGEVWELTSTSGGRVRVVDSFGESIEGATVVQVGLESALDSSFARLAWLLRRTSVTDEGGGVRMSPLAGRTGLVAMDGDDSSAAWAGQLASPVTLHIGHGFAAGGVLRWSRDLPESTVAFVTCEAVTGPYSVEVGQVRLRSDTWGPVSFPLTGAPEVRFRLHGGGVVAREQVIPAPLPGEAVAVDFDLDAGHMLWFHVIDEEGRVIPDAEVIVTWYERGREVSRRAFAREDGYIPVWGCPSGTVLPTLRAPGFVTAVTAPIELPQEHEASLSTVLLRAGRLRGVVVSSDGPVRDFQVAVWPERSPGTVERRTFTGARDGAFELDRVPHGDLIVTATALGFSQGTPRSVSVLPGVVADVRLKLEAPVRALGRVVDATTGEPVPSAEVRVVASDGYNPIGIAGPPVGVAADGVFSLGGVASRLAFVGVSAPGYSSKSVSVNVRAGAEADFGPIRLDRRQLLEVYLRHDEGVDPTEYRLRVDGPDSSVTRSFDRDGFVRVPDLSTGKLRLAAYYPDRTWRVIERTFRATDPWYVEFGASSGATLRVEVLDESGALPADGAWVSVESATALGRMDWSANLDADRRATIRHLPAGMHGVSVRGHPDRGSERLASTRVELGENDDVAIRLRVGETDRRIRVVDEHGLPLAGVSVAIDLVGSDLSLSARDLSDQEGVCVVPGLDAEAFRAHLAHPERGYSFGLEVAASPRGETIELVFREPVSTELVLMRRTGPVVGAAGTICDSNYQREIQGPASDELGRSVWTNLAPGDYVFVFEQDGYWPITKPIAVMAGAAPVRVDLYRLCTLRVEVERNARPAPGTSVFLQRVGGLMPLGDFIPLGYVDSSTGSMTTGSDGSFTLERVAEARYDWAIVLPSGERIEGALEVEPDRENLLRIEL